jgi:hypothetical protein
VLDDVKFSDDHKYGFHCGGTITYTNMQLAVCLGATEIYLLGVDFDYTLSNIRKTENGGHTYDANNSTNYFTADYINNDEIPITPDMASVNLAYMAASKMSIEKQILPIYNCTRGGKLEWFPRVEFDDVISKFI